MIFCEDRDENLSVPLLLRRTLEAPEKITKQYRNVINNYNS